MYYNIYVLVQQAAPNNKKKKKDVSQLLILKSTRGCKSIENTI